MTAHHHAILWIDHREAKLFHLNTTEVDRMILHPRRPTRHIHRNATSIGGGTSLLDDDYFEHVSEATAEAKAILIAGLDSAKSELAAHLTRHHPEAAARIVGVETSIIRATAPSPPSLGSTLTPRTIRSRKSRKRILVLSAARKESHVSRNNPPHHSHPAARRSVPVLAP